VHGATIALLTPARGVCFRVCGEPHARDATLRELHARFSALRGAEAADDRSSGASEKHERNLGRMPPTDGGLEMYDVGDGRRTWRLHASRAALRASPLLQEAREWLVARQRCGAGGVDGGSQMFGNVGGCQSTFGRVQSHDPWRLSMHRAAGNCVSNIGSNCLTPALRDGVQDWASAA
jgi:hypothetical protein